MGPETTFAIGMEHIKERRLTKRLYSYPDLTVGQCVPFYFCPRSVMLYTLHQQDHKDLSYREGQTWIIHLEADMNGAITWATQQNKRWVFTTQNAGSNFFDDYADLENLHKINWQAVAAPYWQNFRGDKQAEFLM
jgi:hypothetical protein